MRQTITKLLEPKDNAPEAAFLLAQLLGAKISRSTLEKEIKNHPDYPAFLSISDVLNNHKVENLTAKFDRDKLAEIPTPFITQVNGKKSVTQFTVVKEITNNTVLFYDPEAQAWSNTSIDDFSTRSNGVVLLADTEEPVVEKDYEKKIAEERRTKLSQNLMAACLPVFLIVSSVLTFYQAGPGAVLPTLYSILTLIGTVATVLLLWYEVDQTNTALQDICTAGKKTNCSAILQSKDAKVFGISWSTIGFVYFSGSLIALLTAGISSLNTLTLLSWLTLAATPYVFYSIYYQWKVTKQWCVLCLSVQAVLVLQSIVIFSAGWYNPSTLLAHDVANLVLHTLPAFAVPFIVVGLLIPALRKAKQSGELAMELQRLKHSPDIFNAVLEKQKPVEHSTDGLGITIGNPNASVKIIKVCNPYCGPCARAHTPMEELLHNNPDLQVQIIFTAANDEKDVKYHPVNHLLAIDQQKKTGLTQQALDDWYLAEKKDYETFAQKYPMNGELKKQGEKIEAMRDWCTKTEIQFTPTFFVNGYQLPSNYSINDLKYFLSV